MYLFGEEIAWWTPTPTTSATGSAKLEFFVVQDIFFSDTCQFADVVFPASPSLEKEGTFTSTERRIQRLYQVLEPLAGSRPDWRIIQDVANPLGANWNYRHPSEIDGEIASLTPLFAGVNYERLEGYKSLQWPVAADGTRSAAALHEKVRVPRRQGATVSRRHVHADGPCQRGVRPAPEQRPDARAFSRGQSDLSQPTASARKLPDTFVEVSPELAKERGIQSGTWVQLISRYGKVRVRALVTDRVTGKRTLHADELDREPRQSSHQQPHRRRDPHAGLQGDFRAHGRAARTSAKARCRASIRASAIPRRKRASRWSANGNGPIIEMPRGEPVRSRAKTELRRTLWPNRSY